MKHTLSSVDLGLIGEHDIEVEFDYVRYEASTRDHEGQQEDYDVYSAIVTLDGVSVEIVKVVDMRGLIEILKDEREN